MDKEVRLASRRERHKDQRRAQIIDAAYALLREVGVDDLSVKMIADRADVSAATVYNLFGAKGAVLQKVYDRDFEGFARKLAAAGSPSALDAIFVGMEIAADLYRSDPSFYRGMSIGNPRAEPELVVSVQGPRRDLSLDLLARAVREGDLVAGARLDLLNMAMQQLVGGAFAAWCAELITVDEMEAQTCYGLARLLLGVARPAARARLRARIAAAEAALPPTQQLQAPAAAAHR
ncbi:MAG TPA: TetR/AcrR family transcriptional regulator [Caulobacteraceae bacterium]|nr:TetR/AcrR family transcriptional regulator [Caulobacteraceae bacterium]